MSTTKTEHVVREDGRCIRRVTTESEIQIANDVLAQLSAGTWHKVINAWHIKGYGNVGLATRSNQCYWTVPLQRLIMKAPFKMINGAMVPLFTSSTDPVLSLEWKPAGDIRLFITQHTVPDPAGNHAVGNTYLFAVDKRGNYWKLPLPNLYDDCRVCMGSNGIAYGANAQELFLQLIMNFEESRWNADLWKTVEQTQNLFRFEPKNEGFVTLPPTASWTQLSVKVSTEITQNCCVWTKS